MASTNFKLFDENKTNLLTDAEYEANVQRQNGVQSGIASSSLQNKFQLQASMMIKAIADLVVSKGFNALDSDTYSTFANNIANTLASVTFGGSDPTTSTQGYVGQLLLVTTAQSGFYRLWICVAVSGGTYTWERVNYKSGTDGTLGTITGITMNGVSMGTSGIVNLGTVITSHQDISHLAPKASPAFTGTPKAPTPATATNSTQIATTAYVKSNLSSYAPLASPVLTGTPTAPTAAQSVNNTQIATTAYVRTAISNYRPSWQKCSLEDCVANTTGYYSGTDLYAVQASTAIHFNWDMIRVCSGLRLNYSNVTFTGVPKSGSTPMYYLYVTLSDSNHASHASATRAGVTISFVISYTSSQEFRYGDWGRCNSWWTTRRNKYLSDGGSLVSLPSVETNVIGFYSEQDYRSDINLYDSKDTVLYLTPITTQSSIRAASGAVGVVRGTFWVEALV